MNTHHDVLNGRTQMVLVSADSEDSVRVRRALDGHGMSVDMLPVATAGELAVALSPLPDVVVAMEDSATLPFCVALRTVQELAPGVPFIVVTDVSDCDRAMQLVADGATDVVWTDRLCRLGISMVQASSARRGLMQKDAAVLDLTRYRERSEAIAAAVPGVIFQAHVDIDGRTTFLYVSEYSEELLGMSPSRLRNNAAALFDCIHPEDRERLWTHVQRANGDDDVLACEVRMLRSGEERWLRFQARSGQQPGLAIWTGFISDITDQIRYEQAMREAMARAEEYNELKLAVLANLSHEIRTPLTAIIGFADLLVSGDTPVDDLPEHASMIRESGDRLQHTLDALLDLARLRSDQNSVQLQKVDVRRLVRCAAEKKGTIARSKDLEFSVVIPDQPVVVNADATALQRVIDHVIGNALKFTAEGSISVAMHIGQGHVHLEVKDTGLGISPEFLPHVFDEFEQESKGLNRAFNGVGIGLAVSRQLVEAMSGTIRIDSEKGSGTRVGICLPLATSPQPAKRTALFDRSVSCADPRMLAVGFDDKHRSVMNLQLKGRAHIDFRDNLKESLSLMTSLIYDVVVVDLDQGSGEHELAAFSRVLKMPEYKGRPVLACTSKLVQTELDRWASGGVTSFLPKPFSLTQLEERLGRLLV